MSRYRYKLSYGLLESRAGLVQALSAQNALDIVRARYPLLGNPRPARIHPRGDGLLAYLPAPDVSYGRCSVAGDAVVEISAVG